MFLALPKKTKHNCSSVLSILGKNSTIFNKKCDSVLTLPRQVSSCSYLWKNLRFVFLKKLFLKKGV